VGVVKFGVTQPDKLFSSQPKDAFFKGCARREILLYLLFEHQTTPDARMPLRLLASFGG
jgi:hypothetical protein